VVGVAEAAKEAGVEQFGDSIIFDPKGETVGACTKTGDEPAVTRCDQDLILPRQSTTINFASKR
jgi:hypothetical protein